MTPLPRTSTNVSAPGRLTKPNNNQPCPFTLVSALPTSQPTLPSSLLSHRLSLSSQHQLRHLRPQLPHFRLAHRPPFPQCRSPHRYPFQLVHQPQLLLQSFQRPQAPLPQLSQPLPHQLPQRRLLRALPLAQPPFPSLRPSPFPAPQPPPPKSAMAKSKLPLLCLQAAQPPPSSTLKSPCLKWPLPLAHHQLALSPARQLPTKLPPLALPPQHLVFQVPEAQCPLSHPRLAASCHSRVRPSELEARASSFLWSLVLLACLLLHKQTA